MPVHTSSQDCRRAWWCAGQCRTNVLPSHLHHCNVDRWRMMMISNQKSNQIKIYIALFCVTTRWSPDVQYSTDKPPATESGQCIGTTTTSTTTVSIRILFMLHHNNIYALTVVPVVLNTVYVWPATEACGQSPVLQSMNVPVPIVHFTSPTLKQHWPNIALCWSATCDSTRWS